MGQGSRDGFQIPDRDTFKNTLKVWLCISTINNSIMVCKYKYVFTNSLTHSNEDLLEEEEEEDTFLVTYRWCTVKFFLCIRLHPLLRSHGQSLCGALGTRSRSSLVHLVKATNWILTLECLFLILGESVAPLGNPHRHRWDLGFFFWGVHSGAIAIRWPWFISLWQNAS